ncbi:dihydroorotase [Desulfosarcina alkanivorans]|uniref:Dihydroorotase n=1 Tax=Desulfosarcina alkanivorans TaxID=571177 RepID=A0A5K7YL99_9BACT|nr:dihydroorotase [Desulfosarcina alkanivorans]BBO69588.1 dihydroorotase [Desulfosarcina alkanivorans]
MATILITNALTINEGTAIHQDLRIRDGRIDAIGGDLSGRGADRVVDAGGRVLLPGMIDDQVHFREPGLTHKGDIGSESRAAVAGGITTYMEMPNTAPATTTIDRLEEKHRIAGQTSYANYSFYLGGANDNIEIIKQLDPKQACGVKVFMGASTGNMLVDDPVALEQIFTHSPTIVATHCEDSPTIDENTGRFQAIHGEDIPIALHPAIRSEAACYQSTALAVELAGRCNTRLHVLHLSTARELGLLSSLPLEKKRITAEVCVHHLFFSGTDYRDKGNLIKCNPAIKTEEDRRQLLAALEKGTIDVVGTDHAPHTLAEKQQPYLKAPSGLPLVQHALVSLLEHVHTGALTLEQVAEKTAHSPAKLFDVRERGYLREGYWADLVLVDLEHPTVVDDQPVHYRCGWTPFAGHTFRSSVAATFVSGHLAYHDGRIDPDPAGQRLEFDR